MNNSDETYMMMALLPKEVINIICHYKIVFDVFEDSVADLVSASSLASHSRGRPELEAIRDNPPPFYITELKQNIWLRKQLKEIRAKGV